MESEQDIIFIYEEMLLGQNAANFSAACEGSLRERQHVIGVIWRYAITHILHWTPEQALTFMDRKIMQALCLEKTLRKLDIVLSSTRYLDLRQILQYAFPKEISYSLEHQAIEEYRHVMKMDEFQYDTTPYRFPKGFFRAFEGMQRAGVIIKYAIETYLGDKTLYQIYHYFGDETKGRAWLKSHHLDIMHISGHKKPLDFVHFTMHPGDGSNFFYANEYLTRLAEKMPDPEYEPITKSMLKAMVETASESEAI